MSHTHRCRMLLASPALLLAIAACAPSADPPAHEAESWSVTAWGERYEIFPEVEPLVVGEVATAHTHVTRLVSFAPLVEGSVEIVLTGPEGEEVFGAAQPSRPGIFPIEIEPAATGERTLAFRIHGPEGDEEIVGGTVRVGTPEEPGGLVAGPEERASAPAGEPVSFLKEQQWRTEFATAWVRVGRLSLSVSGLARVRPPAGGELAVSSPVDGIVRGTPPRGTPPRGAWPFVGRGVAQGEALFQVSPLVAAERSLADLEGALGALAIELETARARRARLQELLELEATSLKEVEEARARVDTLSARHDAVAQDLDAARAARQGGSPGQPLVLRAPFAGRIAAVAAAPGETVSAGDPLARLVRTDVLWLEVALAPAAAREIARDGVRGIVLSDPELSPIQVDEGLRLVAVAPEVSPGNGMVTVLVEVPPSDGLVLGTSMHAQLLLPTQREGVVVPASALVDDGGVPVVYVQPSGESFLRQEVEVLERQGEAVLVDRLEPGLRLVSRGGEAIRRSSLLASGPIEGHVH